MLKMSTMQTEKKKACKYKHFRLWQLLYLVPHFLQYHTLLIGCPKPAMRRAQSVTNTNSQTSHKLFLDWIPENKDWKELENKMNSSPWNENATIIFTITSNIKLCMLLFFCLPQCIYTLPFKSLVAVRFFLFFWKMSHILYP